MRPAKLAAAPADWPCPIIRVKWRCGRSHAGKAEFRARAPNARAARGVRTGAIASAAHPALKAQVAADLQDNYEADDEDAFPPEEDGGEEDVPAVFPQVIVRQRLTDNSSPT